MDIVSYLAERGRERLSQDDKLRDNSSNEILILGQDQSGKSVLFRQLRLIHGSKFSVVEKNSIADDVKDQIRQDMVECLYGIGFNEEKTEDTTLYLSDEGNKAAACMSGRSVNTDIDQSKVPVFVFLFYPFFFCVTIHHFCR